MSNGSVQEIEGCAQSAVRLCSYSPMHGGLSRSLCKWRHRKSVHVLVRACAVTSHQVLYYTLSGLSRLPVQWNQLFYRALRTSFYLLPQWFKMWTSLPPALSKKNCKLVQQQFRRGLSHNLARCPSPVLDSKNIGPDYWRGQIFLLSKTGSNTGLNSKKIEPCTTTGEDSLPNCYPVPV